MTPFTPTPWITDHLPSRLKAEAALRPGAWVAYYCATSPVHHERKGQRRIYALTHDALDAKLDQLDAKLREKYGPAARIEVTDIYAPTQEINIEKASRGWDPEYILNLCTPLGPMRQYQF